MAQPEDRTRNVEERAASLPPGDASLPAPAASVVTVEVLAGAPGAADRGSRTGQPRAVGRKRRAARGARPKHVPQRTCIACRRVEGKRALVRIVRTTAGAVEVDPTGKQNGRGAYLHADPACWDAALRRKALQHALKTELTESDRAGLDAFRAGLALVSEKDEEHNE